MLRAAVEELVRDELCWEEKGRFYVPKTHLDGFTAEPARVAKMNTAGFISMVHILGGFGGPLPISPILLLHIVLGRDRACLIDTELWLRFDVELYQRMTPWLEYDGTSPLPVHDPRISGLISAAVLDVSDCAFHVHDDGSFRSSFSLVLWLLGVSRCLRPLLPLNARWCRRPHSVRRMYLLSWTISLSGTACLSQCLLAALLCA